MIGDAALEHFGKVFADEVLLIEAEREWIGRRQLSGDFCGQYFGGLTARGKD